MDERDLAGLNPESDAEGIGSEAEITAEPVRETDAFAARDPVAGLAELWQKEPAREAAVAEEEEEEENPLRRFAAGAGAPIAEEMSERRRAGLVRRLSRKRPTKLVAAAATMAFLVWWGGEVKGSSDRRQAAEFVHADLVAANGFQVADRLSREVKQAAVAVQADSAGEYRRGVRAGVDLMLDEMLAGSVQAPEVQAGLLAEILEMRTREVRVRVEGLIRRARDGGEVPFARLHAQLQPIYGPIEAVIRSGDGVFTRRDATVRWGSGTAEVALPVSRDARLSAALIAAYEIEHMIRLHAGHEAAAAQLEAAIRAEAETLDRGRHGLKGEVFGAAAALPILSRAQNAGVRAPTGSDAFEAGLRATVEAAGAAVREAVLNPDSPSVRPGPRR